MVRHYYGDMTPAGILLQVLLFAGSWINCRRSVFPSKLIQPSRSAITAG